MCNSSYAIQAVVLRYPLFINSEYYVVKIVMDIFGVTLARAAYFPSLAFGLFMNRFGRRPWYSKIDNTVILGALPFRSHTQQVYSASYSYTETYNDFTSLFKR